MTQLIKTAHKSALHELASAWSVDYLFTPHSHTHACTYRAWWWESDGVKRGSHTWLMIGRSPSPQSDVQSGRRSRHVFAHHHHQQSSSSIDAFSHTHTQSRTHMLERTHARMHTSLCVARLKNVVYTWNKLWIFVTCDRARAWRRFLSTCDPGPSVCTRESFSINWDLSSTGNRTHAVAKKSVHRVHTPSPPSN